MTDEAELLKKALRDVVNERDCYKNRADKLEFRLQKMKLKSRMLKEKIYKLEHEIAVLWMYAGN